MINIFILAISCFNKESVVIQTARMRPFHFLHHMSPQEDRKDSVPCFQLNSCLQPPTATGWPQRWHRSLDNKDLMCCYASNTNNHSSRQVRKGCGWKRETCRGRTAPFWGQFCCSGPWRPHSTKQGRHGNGVKEQASPVEGDQDHQKTLKTPSIYIKVQKTVHANSFTWARNLIPGRGKLTYNQVAPQSLGDATPRPWIPC